jgi:glycosyltransferase involved in cell wall biosynthesis
MQFELTWVGDGAWRDECEQVGVVTGMVDNPLKFLKKADVVLANSYLSILEAQALGKIVLALYTHPLKQKYLETFPGSKMMLVAGDAQELVANFLSLLAKPALMRQYQTLARIWAGQQTWEKVAAQYFKLWQNK